jgi:hypothetical protein
LAKTRYNWQSAASHTDTPSASRQRPNHRSENVGHGRRLVNHPGDVFGPAGFVFQRAIGTVKGDAAGVGVGEFLPVQRAAQFGLDRLALLAQLFEAELASLSLM